MLSVCTRDKCAFRASFGIGHQGLVTLATLLQPPRGLRSRNEASIDYVEYFIKTNLDLLQRYHDLRLGFGSSRRAASSRLKVRISFRLSSTLFTMKCLPVF